MNSIKLFLLNKKYGVIIIIMFILAFIAKDKINFKDVPIDTKLLITKKRMFNVFSNDVLKDLLKKIENNEPLEYIQDYKLNYQEGLPEKIDIGTLLYFPYENTEFVYFKESDKVCYYPEKNSLIVVENPLEIISDDKLNNFKVIIGKNNIHI
tara:strand:+ start:1257 stop:1712 length:456 start_codon:yes stop_codon:yes gene_type:complete